jgi:hypothetical protein
MEQAINSAANAAPPILFLLILFLLILLPQTTELGDSACFPTASKLFMATTSCC